jgi:hypothetical protein
MRALAVYLLAIVLANAGCEAASPVAPGIPDTLQNGTSIDAAATVQMSGWVYANTTWADPPIADAFIEVRTSDGSATTTRSDATGYYELTVPRGTGVASVTTTKSGYLPTAHQVTLAKVHTVLNFFLSPL